MKRALVLACLVALLIWCSPAPGALSSGGEVSLEGQLVEMIRLIYTASNINVINGLNLSREQLSALRAMTADVEEAAEPVADSAGALPPALAKVSGAYRELQGVLLRQEPVSEELRGKVLEARKIEASFLRSGLAYDPSCRYGECRRCHSEPREGRGEWRGLPAGAAQEQGFAHIYAILGRTGLAAVAKKGAAVSEVLNDNQKVMLSEFSCCLIPPQSLSDPVRIGQAQVADWELKLLSDVRRVPERLWPQAKSKVLDKLDSAQVVKDPGATARAREEARARIAAVLDEARSLSEVDFELKKESLVAKMKGLKKTELDEKRQQFMRAFFLLVPGSRAVYDARLEGE